MDTLFALFTSPGFKLAPVQRKRATLVLVFVAVLLVAAAAAFLGYWSRGTLPGEDPRSDLQVLASAILFRFPGALALLAVGALAAFVLFRGFERSSIGHQLVNWHEEDPESVVAARIHGTLQLVGLVFLGVCVLLAAVVR